MSRVFRKQADVASDCITYNKLNYDSLYLDIKLLPVDNGTDYYQLDLDKFIELKLANRCDKVCVSGVFTFKIKNGSTPQDVTIKIRFYRDEARTILAFEEPYIRNFDADESKTFQIPIDFCEVVPLAITEDKVKYYVTIDVEATEDITTLQLAKYSFCAEEASNCDNLCCNTCSSHKCYSSSSKSCDASVFCNQPINKPIYP